MIRVPPDGLLEEQQLAVDQHVEYASTRGHQRDLRDTRLELLYEPLRQTDGSYPVASARAVLDGESHGRAVYRREPRFDGNGPALELARAIHARCGIDVRRERGRRREETGVGEGLRKVAD